jgi:pyruvate dehydrogenase E1 component
VRATLLGSGTILRECLAAAEMLEKDFGVPADVYSVTSFSELRREALECERWNLLHPKRSPHVPYVQTLLGMRGPDHRRHRLHAHVPDQIRQWVEKRVRHARHRWLRPLDAAPSCAGTFEVDRNFIASRRSRRWPMRARSIATWVAGGNARPSASIRRRPIPLNS